LRRTLPLDHHRPQRVHVAPKRMDRLRPIASLSSMIFLSCFPTLLRVPARLRPV
jgi:hypothetical protein